MKKAERVTSMQKNMWVYAKDSAIPTIQGQALHISDVHLQEKSTL